MNGKILAGCFALVNAVVSCPMAGAETGAMERAAIWHLSDADSEIWIFGSFHVLPEGYEWRPEGLETALDRTERVWFETDLSPEAFQRTGALLVETGRGDGGLVESLPERHQATLADLAAELGFPLAVIDAAEPWYAALTVVQLGSVRDGADPASGVEMVLAGEAMERGIPVTGLETPEEHVALFTGLSEEAQRAFLESAIEQSGDAGALLDGLRQAWSAQDFAAIEAYGDGSFGSVHPELEQRLLVERNEAWVETIQERLNGEGRDLFVVGAVHTVGDDGIIASLRSAGYRVDGPDMPASH